jgi:hypothetical protein
VVETIDLASREAKASETNDVVGEALGVWAWPKIHPVSMPRRWVVLSSGPMVPTASRPSAETVRCSHGVMTAPEVSPHRGMIARWRLCRARVSPACVGKEGRPARRLRRQRAALLAENEQLNERVRDPGTGPGTLAWKRRPEIM